MERVIIRNEQLVSIEDVLKDDSKYKIERCADVVFDLTKGTILIPWELYEALGKPTAAQMLFNDKNGFLVIVKEAFAMSRFKKSRAGRPSKQHGIFNEKDCQGGVFVIKTSHLLKMRRHLGVPISGEQDEGPQPDRKKYRVPGRMIENRIAVYQLEEAVEDDSYTSIPREMCSWRSLYE